MSDQPAALAPIQERVVEVVRELAAELGGARAARAAAPHASLERDLGLGSLERVELLVRLEAAFGKALDDRFLQVDTPAELAGALLREGASQPIERGPRAAALRAAAAVAEARTIHGALWTRAEADPDRPHVFMREEDGREHTISYSRLASEAAGVAGGLQARSVKRGDRVALMLPTGIDFLRSFQGILMAGAIPVPIYPPLRLDRIQEYARRQSSILADAGVSLLITVPRAGVVADMLAPSVPTLHHVASADELAAAGPGRDLRTGSGSQPAFIQYTSGSTGMPKGVLLTHDNLLANIRAIAQGIAATPDDVVASWLPLYHDMGLIGSWLFCMQQGLPITIQSPTSFLTRPERWLWAIHQHRATLSAAPNFAYELCVRKIADPALQGIDLSSWRVALNGAEPVNPETLERFIHRFEPYGFRREAMCPVYGLAENSVALCFPPPGRGPRVMRVERDAFATQGRAVPATAEDPGALGFVSVGSPLPEHEVRLLDDAGHEVADNQVGQLAFRGPSMMAGYYRKPEATAAIALPGGFLDSGDLAFRAEGEIYITGRKKDLIIKAGRNLVPQEIEEAASAIEGIRRGCVAAFGVSRPELGTEGLVVVAETRSTDAAERDRLIGAITERVAAAVGVPPDSVVLVPPGTVPKTSSGKIRRADTRAQYQSGALGNTLPSSAAARARLLAGFGRSWLQQRLAVVPRLFYALWLGLWLLALAPGFWLLLLLFRGRRRTRWLGRAGARVLLRLGGCRLEAEGLDRLPAEGALILASNHTSYVDVLALLALLPREFAFVAKQEAEGYPLVGRYLRQAEQITVERWEGSKSVADAGKVPRALEAGECVLVFPEGTFTGSAGLRPFRLGAFKAAAETGTRVVPLALRGARQVLRDGVWLPHPGPIQLWVGEPIATPGSSWRDIVELRDQVAAAIAERCGEPRLDLVEGGPARPEAI